MDKKNIIKQILQFLVIFIILCFINTALGLRNNSQQTATTSNNSNRIVASVQRPPAQPNRVVSRPQSIEQPLPKENNPDPAGFQTFLEENNQRLAFLKHFNTGRKSYKKDDYGTALEEFTLANQIYSRDPYTYYYLAMIHRDMDRYDEGIKAAKEGVKYDESESLYSKHEGYKVDNNVRYWTYKVMGDCYRYDGRYQEAKEAYSKEIDNNMVKYRDTYLRRGKCNYYLKDMEAARRDFENHRLVINKYFSNQAGKSLEYRDKKPKYDRSDLVDLDEWINKTYK